MTDSSADRYAIADDDLRDLVAFLAQLYEDADEKPRGYSILVRELPDLHDELIALKNRSHELFGAAIDDYLTGLGVLADKRRSYSQEKIDEAQASVDDILMGQNRSANLLLEEARQHEVNARKLAGAIDAFTEAFVEAKSLMGGAWRARYIDENDDPTFQGAYLEEMRGVAQAEALAVPYLQRMLDAFGTQQRTGGSASGLSVIAQSIRDFYKHALAGINQVYDEDVEAVEHARIFRESDTLKRAKAALSYILTNYLDRKKSLARRNVSQAREATGDNGQTALPPVKAAELERKEAGLTGLDLEVFQFVETAGGAVDLATIKQRLAIPKDLDSLYQYCILPLTKEGLLIASNENAPFGGAESYDERFYSWRHMDDRGNLHLDESAFYQWICARIESLSHKKNIADLSKARSTLVSYLRERELLDENITGDLKDTIASIDNQIDILKAEAAANQPELDELDKILYYLANSKA